MFKKEFFTVLRHVLISIGALAYIAAPSVTQAQSWPDKPIKLISLLLLAVPLIFLEEFWHNK